MNRSDKVGIGSFSGLGKVLLVSVVAVIISGCIFSGDDDADQDESAASKSSTLSTIIAATKAAGGEFNQNAPGSAGSGGASSRPARPHAPTVAAVAVVDQDLARKLLWVHLSRCITFNAVDIEAVQVNDEMYVRASEQSQHDTGLWKVLSTGTEIEPYDDLAKAWSNVVKNNCDPNLQGQIATPMPIIANAESAALALWSSLVVCFPDLSVTNIRATESHLSGTWIITTDDVHLQKMDRSVNFGVWSFDGSTGGGRAANPLAEQWYSFLANRCDVTRLESIKQLFPLPTPGFPVNDHTEAQNRLWAYLSPCFPDRTPGGTVTTSPVLDPKSGTWTITQPQTENRPPSTPGGPTVTAKLDTAVWTVNVDGKVTPMNKQAIANDKKIKESGC